VLERQGKVLQEGQHLEILTFEVEVVVVVARLVVMEDSPVMVVAVPD